MRAEENIDAAALSVTAILAARNVTPTRVGPTVREAYRAVCSYRDERHACGTYRELESYRYIAGYRTETCKWDLSCA